MPLRTIATLGLALAFAFALPARAAPGDLDRTFGPGGQPSSGLPFGGSRTWGHAEDSLRAMRPLSGGKVILAGVGRQGAQVSLLAVRLNADRTPDATFGTNGIVKLPLTGAAPDVLDVAAHPTDGYVFLTTTNGDDLLLVSRGTDGQGSIPGFGAFGNTGVAPVSVSLQGTQRARKIVWDGTGYLIAFDAVAVPNFAEDFALVRVNADGTPSAYGSRAAGFQCAPGRLHDLKIDGSGRAIVAGQCQTVGPGAANQSAIARMTAAGAMDATFSPDLSGRRFFDVEPGNPNGFRAIEIDAQGQLVLLGSAVSPSVGGQALPFTALLDGDGEPVAGYGAFGDGFAFFPGFAGGDFAHAALGSNGRLFVGGHYPEVPGRLATFIVQDDGTLDPGGALSESKSGTDTYRIQAAFAQSGRFHFAIEMGQPGNKAWRYDRQDETSLAYLPGDVAPASTIDPLRAAGGSYAIAARPGGGGYILAGTATDEAGATRFEVGALGADGNFDPGFAGGGRTMLAQDGVAHAVAIDVLGRIYLAGESAMGTGTIVRLLSNGTPDTNFGLGGSLFVDPLGQGESRLRAIVQQPDGRIVLAGRALAPNGTTRIGFVTRIDTNGATDPLFGAGAGYVLMPGQGEVRALALLPDGRIIAAGHFSTGGADLALIARLTTAGVLDPAFGPGGIGMNFVNLGGVDTRVHAVALLPGGRIAGFGLWAQPGEQEVFGLRLTPEGLFDNAFGTYVFGLTSSADEALGAAVQPDGKVILTGIRSGPAMLTARILPSTFTRDPAWAGGGIGGFSGFVESGTALVYEPARGTATIAAEAQYQGQGAIRIQAPYSTNVVAYVNGPVALQVGTPGTFTVTLANATGAPVTGFTAGPIGYGGPTVTNAAPPVTDCPGLVTGAPGTSAFSQSGTGAPLANGAWCTVTLSLVASSAGSSTFEVPVGAVVASTGATNVDLTAMTIIVQGTGDTTPNAFSFVPVTGAMPGAVITSAAATITGIDTPAPISVANGSYSIGCTGTFVTAAGTITNGQSVCVRHTASASISTSITTTLTIGGVSAAFTSTTAATTANLQVTQVYPSAGIGAGFDHVFNVIVRNLGAEAATGVTLTDTLPAGSRFIWATPGCTHAAGVVTCAIGTMNAGEVLAFLFVVRPPMPGAITNTATIASSLPDVDQANNTSTLTSQVAATPAGVPVDRYRLYSLILLRHHFTTSSNEYNTLVSFAGAWVGEGVAGRLLDRPGTYNGVEAVPFYRLYIPATQGHLWTADPNEYYTLHFIYRYASEGVDGFILPTQAPGTVPLHRLFYPAAQPANTRHLWTLDANERAALLASGWTDEGVAGYVIP